MNTKPLLPRLGRMACRHGCLLGIAALASLVSLPASAAHFEVSASGTEVSDTLTGLTWRRCAEGQAWDGSRCAGTALSMDWSDALTHAHSQAKSTGLSWRLPNIKELASLVDDTRSNPATDPEAFPDTSGDCFWSSSLDRGFNGEIWSVYFGYGEVYHINRATASCEMRLVRVTK